MHDSAFARKLDEIIRLGKQLISKVGHINRTLSRSSPHNPEPEESNDTSQGNTVGNAIPPNRNRNNEPQQKKTKGGHYFWKWTVAELIQAVIGFLLFLTLLYSIRSYNLSIETRNLQLRAWMTFPTIQFAELPTSAGEKPRVPPVHVGFNPITIELRNAGETPATHVHMHTNPIHFEGSSCQMESLRSPYTSDLTYGPKEGGTNQNTVLVITQACLDALQHGTAVVKLDGEVIYTTIFGEEHHSWFCAQIDGQTTGLVTACPEGNNID